MKKETYIALTAAMVGAVAGVGATLAGFDAAAVADYNAEFRLIAVVLLAVLLILGVFSSIAGVFKRNGFALACGILCTVSVPVYAAEARRLAFPYASVWAALIVLCMAAYPVVHLFEKNRPHVRKTYCHVIVISAVIVAAYGLSTLRGEGLWVLLLVAGVLLPGGYYFFRSNSFSYDRFLPFGRGKTSDSSASGRPPDA
jgi:hypothetical protein